jgi:hypothetical protein
MFKVLKDDGPNILTDLGGICLQPMAYADGGNTTSASVDDWRRMKTLFIQSPRLLGACEELEALIGVMFGEGEDAIIPETIRTPLGVDVKLAGIMRDLRSIVVAAKGGAA